MGGRLRAVRRLLFRDAATNCSNMVKRAREPVISVGSAAIATGATEDVKGDQTWMYANGVIKRAHSTVLGGTEYFDHKDPESKLPRRKHESNFFITINTNKGGKKNPIATTEKNAVATTLEFLALETNMCKYLCFGPKHPGVYKDDKFEDVIESTEWEAAVETGPNLGRLHCHIWLTLHHFSQVQVDRAQMGQMFKEKFNAHCSSDRRMRGRAYVNVKLLPTSDWAMVMKQYIHKGMRA